MSKVWKDCPFCGNGFENCACSFETMAGYNQKLWNTRPIEDALRARIAELEAQTRWIPVSERLPDTKKDTLYLCTINRDGKKIVDCRTFFTGYRQFSFPVTHWMPLPSSPESEG